jgi:hypothetical protein
MVQRREHLRFALEPCDPVGIGGKDVRENLDRNVPIQPRISRSVDLTHSACADDGENFIWPETDAGRQAHG